MKRVITAVCILLAVTSFCVWELIFLQSIICEYTSGIENIQSLVWEEKIDIAKDETMGIINDWKAKHGVVSTFIDHEPLQEIEESLTLMMVNLENDEVSDFSVESQKALVKLEHLNTTEMPLLGNIL